jgi:hypothetical protein
MSAQDLKKLNGILHPDKIDVGQELVYYRTGQ